ncbi:trigger factor [Flagellimonas taeanensis]|jgi:trigger factor|uniref:Trigger factor n=1 Tax=Flagellimonas taeanensis TaxID=1005926 RepID=A0A1M6TMN9_9FLAO|nr:MULTISPECIES: trigger factor [Allomuricauda]MDC6384182.1 trigger factor [Muricauda sp. SK9]MEE1962263.1 trigger factor [Allomuricauda taeanensis]RIV49553.1 trigger factor [Allomuricauda taeanensis]SFB89300.1 trigger factor [Allomuricauda taeanensis]SHK58176.1 trigger factor [Allomuricauda taeanensis]
MNITKEQIDDLNAVVKVAISKEDYQDKVEKILKDYRKQANIPGFRKGQVPMGLIKKQYGKAVLVDEVNKLLQDNLNKYLTEEKLDVLGNPLPKQQENFDWDKDHLDFEFELGLAPSFDVQLKTKKAVTQYKIVADKKMIDEQVERIQKQYGKLVSKGEVGKKDEVTGTFANEAEDIDHKTTIEIDKIKSKKALDALTGKKVGEAVTLPTKGLFKEDYLLSSALGINRDKAEKLDVTVTFTIGEINEREPAALDQDLFDKLFGKDKVTSEKELKDRIKEDSEKQFEQQSDQKLLNDITEKLIEETKFELPAEFLKKWIQISGEKPLSEDEAKEEFERSEKGLRYQLIEGKIIQENNLQVQFDELKEFAKGFIKSQMAQYGHLDPKDEELEGIAARVLGNQDEVRRLSEQLMSQKLLDLYKEKANLKVKEVSYDDFIKEAYS